MTSVTFGCDTSWLGFNIGKVEVSGGKHADARSGFDRQGRLYVRCGRRGARDTLERAGHGDDHGAVAALGRQRGADIEEGLQERVGKTGEEMAVDMRPHARPALRVGNRGGEGDRPAVGPDQPRPQDQGAV